MAPAAMAAAASSLMPKQRARAWEKTNERMVSVAAEATATVRAFFSTAAIPSLSDSPVRKAVTADRALDAPSNIPAGIVPIVYMTP